MANVVDYWNLSTAGKRVETTYTQ